jgi:hypothetical protein
LRITEKPSKNKIPDENEAIIVVLWRATKNKPRLSGAYLFIKDIFNNGLNNICMADYA